MTTTTTAPPVRRPRAAGREEGPLSTWRAEIGVGSGLVLLCALWAAVAPNFLSLTNLTLLFQQMSVLMIVAVGQTFVVLTGEIDLSVGSTIGLTTVGLATLTVVYGVALPVAIAIVLAGGVAIGMFTGLLRVVWGIPSFIITLGLLSALQGAAFTISNGVTVSPIPAGLSPLWDGSLAGVPAPIWIMIGTIAIGTWVLRQTRYGRHIYALGGNPEACRRYGLNVGALRVSTFVIVQCLAVLGGLLYAAQLDSGNATVGRGMELNVIAGVVVGGVSLFGGVGRIAGTAIGVVFIAVLGNGLTLLGVSSYLFLVAQGLVVVAAVLWSSLQRRGRTEGRERT
jgi:ribose/xylose/arabinose/galactoside ABC-type transport system permease subunit